MLLRMIAELFLSTPSAMTTLYRNRLESCVEKNANCTFTDTAAKLALESVLSIVRNVIDTKDDRNNPITLPGIILYYLVAKAIIGIPTLHLKHMNIIPGIIRLLKVYSQKNGLAGKYRYSLLGRFCTVYHMSFSNVFYRSLSQTVVNKCRKLMRFCALP